MSTKQVRRCIQLSTYSYTKVASHSFSKMWCYVGQSIYFFVLQLVSRHVIEIKEFGFINFGTELRRVVGLHQILAGSFHIKLTQKKPYLF